ncbi:ras-interacting protein 1-like, partial [Phasianus colchicus]|uniref:ras-interacting protein 1-like n=1 Tax=Phasianus colchicus TaxID=9054 RepID=UPI00129EA78C
MGLRGVLWGHLWGGFGALTPFPPQEKIKEIGERQPDNPQEAPPGIQAVSEQLRPLLLWLANGVELLNIAQGRVAEMEAEMEMDGAGGG